MHTPYQNRLKRNPDFLVEYEIDLHDAVKSGKPTQGMRVDFLYCGDDPAVDGIHMIWPEVLDENGKVQTDDSVGKIPAKGKANMWVVDDQRISYHLNRLKLGTKGFWYRGGRIANVTVIGIEGQKC